MGEVELVKVSQRGQIVIPRDIRKLLRLKGGERFVVRAKGDVILLKKVEIPELGAEWDEVFNWGEKFAREKGLKEEDVEKVVHQARGVEG